MTATASAPATEPALVPVWEVERELARQMKALHAAREAPLLRARMSNLVIFCQRPERAEEVVAELPAVAAVHPARVLLLLAESGAGNELKAAVHVQAHPAEGGRWICTEQVRLRATGTAIERLPFEVRELVVGDLPINLWWASSQPPPLAGAILYDLAEHAQQIIYDSIGWEKPAQAVAAVAGWLPAFERQAGPGRRRVASDLNWRRLKYWRRALAQALDPATTPGAWDSISEVQVEHGPHAVVQAWQLASWLAARLGWQVEEGQVRPGQEIAWHVAGPKAPIRLRLRRLAAGPPEVRRVRLACSPQGRATALDVTVQDDRRLAVVVEGADAAPRTLTATRWSFADLVGRQLSDRDRDPVFHQAMAVAGVLARSLMA